VIAVDPAGFAVSKGVVVFTADVKAWQKEKGSPLRSDGDRFGVAQPSTIEPTSSNNDSFSDSGIVIVDDSLEIDQEKINEERRAYLEEARSQEAFD